MSSDRIPSPCSNQDDARMVACTDQKPAEEKEHQREDWCISIKTVGGGFDDRITNNANAMTSSSGERLFNVIVSPEDRISSLYREIEGATGVKAHQQRLIYRGRIINDFIHPAGQEQTVDRKRSSGQEICQNEEDNRAELSINNIETSGASSKSSCNDPSTRKIKDIAGLCDGQTIHLVKKRDSATSSNENNSSEGNSSTETPQSSTGRGSSMDVAADLLNANGRGSGGGSGGGALLAALLGLGSLADDGLDGGTRDNSSDAATTPVANTTPSSWRPTRNRSRRPHYRLSASDLDVPDPGSMEPVRQGLMTLHTLLPHSELYRENSLSPLEANREWFRGQWLDCRDTVNQWLEATVVEILRPEDILPGLLPQSKPDNEIRRRLPTIDNDPAISANDLEGRRRLLLEPCSPGDPEELNGDLVGYRPRANNNGVQLLLIHYNGWPRRWDEWIRSDSERIRPFRARSRHPNSSVTASPTPQSVFSDAPRTNIAIGDELNDRAALLPELSRTISQVNSLLAELVRRGVSENEAIHGPTAPSPRAHDDLPWLTSTYHFMDTTGDESDDEDYTTAGLEALERTNNIDVLSEVNENGDESTSWHSGHSSSLVDSRPRQSYTQNELRNLATIFDRLGRTLTDAAPHVVSFAASLPVDRSATLAQMNERASESDAVSDTGAASAPLVGLLSLWSRERRRQQNPTVLNPTSTSDLTPTLDPDHLDYASGLVNTTRGEVRTGPRNRASQDDIANVLGAYLAAASLSGLVGSEDGNNDENLEGIGRLLTRGGGTGGNIGGGIDIHIHAVVTTGGGDDAGAGLVGFSGTAGGGVTTTTGTLGSPPSRSLFSSARSSRGGSSILRARNSASASSSTFVDGDEDNEDLFSELYSENPEPVDPNGSPDVENRGIPSDSPLRVSTIAPREFSPHRLFPASHFSYEEPQGSNDSTGTRLRFSSGSRRQSSGRRSYGVFRLFRRRSRSRRND